MAGGSGLPTSTTENPNATGGVGRGTAYTPTANGPTFTNFANTPLATNFSESEYLNAYKDVADAVRRGDIKSGMQHYLQYGQSEGRTPGPGAAAGQALDYLNRPYNDQQYLAANPDVAQAIANRQFTGTGREHYLMMGQAENRAPSAVANRGSSITTPSYYNTNPYAVDYANIFNPQATQVAYRQQSLTPQQQANYLSEWQQDYNQRLQAGVANARAQRVANAQAVQADYNTKKAQAEAQAAASNQEAINRAVQEALAQQQSYGSNNDGYGFYTGAAGGIASLAKGFKK